MILSERVLIVFFLTYGAKRCSKTVHIRHPSKIKIKSDGIKRKTKIDTKKFAAKNLLGSRKNEGSESLA